MTKTVFFLHTWTKNSFCLWKLFSVPNHAIKTAFCHECIKKLFLVLQNSLANYHFHDVINANRFFQFLAKPANFWVPPAIAVLKKLLNTHYSDPSWCRTTSSGKNMNNFFETTSTITTTYSKLALLFVPVVKCGSQCTALACMLKTQNRMRSNTSMHKEHTSSPPNADITVRIFTIHIITNNHTETIGTNQILKIRFNRVVIIKSVQNSRITLYK